MSKKAWIVFVVVVIALIGGLVYLSSRNKIDVSNVNEATIQPATAESGNIADHVFGNASSKVKLVEYGDFQCPGCGGAYPQLKTLSTKYQDQIAFVFRNFPLTTIHPNARAAAAAAEAAGLQGKYWEMHNQLYETQSTWESASADERTSIFLSYATQLGLNTDTFTKDLAGNAINQKISFDQALGKKANVNSTPTLFLDGQIVSDKIIENTIQGNGSLLDAAIVKELRAHNIALPKSS